MTSSTTFNFEPNETGRNNVDTQDDSNTSSLSKTIGNIMNLVNDGLYRIKNRTKSE